MLISFWFYIFIYNITIATFILIIINHSKAYSKTLYQFSFFKNNPFENLSLSILFFSMAGIPPFLGFFSKLIILVLLTYTNFFLLYFNFFFLLFVGLYFYLQNLRFLYSSVSIKSNTLFFLYERNCVIYYNWIILVFFSLTTSCLFLDEIILYFTWLLQ